MKNFFKKTISAVLALYTLAVPLCAAAQGERSEACTGESPASAEEELAVLSENVSVGSRLTELLFPKEKDKDKEMSLLAGGDVFGVKIKQKHVSVTSAPGIPALRAGDIILKVNGKEVHTAEEIKKAISDAGGESITITALHGTEKINLELRPTKDGNEYKIGATLRDSAVGIGTITFFDPETGLFGGLGHGICDSESGQIIEMESGDITGVILGGIHRGESGKPGELSGILTEDDRGDLHRNCECGVFGIADFTPKDGDMTIKVGKKSEVHEGEAKIISTLKNGKKAEYKIEIYDIDKNSDSSKSFRIRVTDKTLLAISGGIVRGMSGSPIIQDGKLIGAVTHVMVADPKEGYGIFIENMLREGKEAIEGLPKAA